MADAGWRNRLPAVATQARRSTSTPSVGRTASKVGLVMLVVALTLLGIVQLGPRLFTKSYYTGKPVPKGKAVPWDASQARSRGEAYADRTDWAVWSLPECTWVSQVAPTFQPLADSKLAFIVGNYTVYLNDILDDFTPWSITHGTLLGAYRHDGMIPWDLDYDISLPAINESYWHMRRATEAHPFWSPRLGVCAPGEDWKRYDKLGRDLAPKEHRGRKFYSGDYTLTELDMIRINRRGIISGGTGSSGLCGGNQLDAFGSANNGVVSHDNVLGYGAQCRCYFRGVPTWCVEDAAGFLADIYGPNFMTNAETKKYGGFAFKCP